MKYCFELTEDEADLGFQKLILDGVYGGAGDPSPGLVIGRILNRSEIVVKVNWEGEYQYVQRRWGYNKPDGEGPSDAEWYPVDVPFKNVAEFLQQFDFKEEKDEFPPGIVGVPFTFQIFEG